MSELVLPVRYGPHLPGPQAALADGQAPAKPMPFRCVLARDYGTRAMSQRGYNVILLHDGTCAIESADTLQEERLLEAAILGIEMFVGSSITSQAVLDACTC